MEKGNQTSSDSSAIYTIKTLDEGPNLQSPSKKWHEGTVIYQKMNSSS
jgi:hypothetical protein